MPRPGTSIHSRLARPRCSTSTSAPPMASIPASALYFYAARQHTLQIGVIEVLVHLHLAIEIVAKLIIICL